MAGMIERLMASERRKSGPKRDFTGIGPVTAPGFARLPDPGRMFLDRSQRFAALAEGHALAPYLRFLSQLAAVQHEAQETLPDHALTGTPLPLSGDPSFPVMLEWFLAHAVLPDAPAEADDARLRLAAMPAADQLALAEAIRGGAYIADDLGACLYAGAALQVHFARAAARLDVAALQAAEDNVCPACGNGPVASMIVGWPGADRARYCFCGLCGTAWNYVRIKCTSCGSTGGIAYFILEEQSKDIGVETCSDCRTYIKHLHHHRDPVLDPIADDVASFGLDLLVQEEGFRRTTPNPLMVMRGN